MDSNFGIKPRPDSSAVYQDYIGQVGHYSCGPVSVTGVPIEINLQDGYMKFQPSLVGWGEDQVRIEEDVPTTLLTERGNPIVMRPLKDGDLQKIVAERMGPKKATSESEPQQETQQGVYSRYYVF